ncbi:hypothetical protein ACU8KH_00964 [Lachancea thermotolerans]
MKDVQKKKFRLTLEIFVKESHTYEIPLKLPVNRKKKYALIGESGSLYERLPNSLARSSMIRLVDYFVDDGAKYLPVFSKTQDRPLSLIKTSSFIQYLET